MYVTAENRGAVKCYANNNQTVRLVKAPQKTDDYYLLLANGKKQKHELFYGSGFLSQSGRYINQPAQNLGNTKL